MRPLKIPILIFGLFLSLTTVLLGQNKMQAEVDSLAKFLEEYTQRDTIRVKALAKYVGFTLSSTYDECIPLIEEGIAISEEINFPYGKGKCYRMYAALMNLKGEIPQALKYAMIADSLINIYGTLDEEIALNLEILRIHQSTGNLEKALEIGFKNIQLTKDFPPSFRKGDIYFKTANIYNELEQHDKAIEYYLKAQEVAKAIESQQLIYVSKGSLANAYSNAKQYQKALTVTKEVLAFAEKINNKPMIGASYSILAEANYGLGNYSNALAYNEKSIELQKEFGRLRVLQDLYNFRSKYYTKLNDYKAANEWLFKYQEIKDSIYSIDKATIVENTKTKYETEKVEKENKLLVEKQRRNNQLITGGAIFGFILLSLIAFIYSRLQIINRQKRELDLAYTQLEEVKKIELATSNLKALQSQMNPHFIFNALNSVQDLVLLKDIRNSNKYLGKFSDLIRKILLSSKKQFISLDEELEILRLYLDLEQLRFGEEFSVDFQVLVSKDRQNTIELPAMFIQPYIENAIKHGLFHKKGDKQLTVAFEDKGDHLKCIIEDNGIGQAKAAEMKIKNLHLHTGFSTQATNERIQLFNETLDKKIGLQTEDLLNGPTPAGTRIILTFPT